MVTTPEHQKIHQEIHETWVELKAIFVEIENLNTSG